MKHLDREFQTRAVALLARAHSRVSMRPNMTLADLELEGRLSWALGVFKRNEWMDDSAEALDMVLTAQALVGAS